MDDDCTWIYTPEFGGEVWSQIDFELVEVMEVCREVATHFKWELHDKGLEMMLSLPDSCYVRADRSALANQVLSNLLSNAIKFSERGQTIEITCREQDNFVAIFVKDEGVGLLPEETFSSGATVELRFPSIVVKGS